MNWLAECIYEEIIKKTVNHFISISHFIFGKKTMKTTATRTSLKKTFRNDPTKTFLPPLPHKCGSVLVYAFMSQWIVTMMMNFRQAPCYNHNNSTFCAHQKFSLHFLLDFTGNNLHKTFNISSYNSDGWL